jgi:hypothetical protein
MNTGANTISQGGRPAGLVTVLVSCCGQLEYTRYCAPSVLRFSRAPVELMFLDCDSFDGTADYLDGFMGAAAVKVEVVRVPAEPPLGPGRKEDIVPIRGEFVALVDNDTIVTAGWLERLVSLASTAADVGMVGPMSNHAPPAQRVEAIPYGIEWDETARPSPWPAIDKVNRFARQWQEEHPGEAFEAESLGGGCVLLKRSVLQKLGTFPTRTPLGTFDTEALSTRVRGAGYRLLGCREVFVHSFGSRRAVRHS